MTGLIDNERVAVTALAVATARDLARLQADEWVHPVVLHVCCRGSEETGRGEYLSGHVPGAVCVELDSELGPQPMPSMEQLQDAARRWGIRPGSSVVVYDAVGGRLADRVSWLLRWGGLSDVRVLDGGPTAWEESGGRLATDDVVPRPGNVRLSAA